MVINMSKETFYFQHDYEPTSDPKIQALLSEYGGLGYGVFWRIIEMLHSSECHRLELKDYVFTALANQMKGDVEQIKLIINYLIDPCELLMKDANNIWSTRVDRYFEWRRDISEKRSEAGRKGGQASAKQIQA